MKELTQQPAEPPAEKLDDSDIGKEGWGAGYCENSVFSKMHFLINFVFTKMHFSSAFLLRSCLRKVKRLLEKDPEAALVPISGKQFNGEPLLCIALRKSVWERKQFRRFAKRF